MKDENALCVFTEKLSSLFNDKAGPPDAHHQIASVQALFLHASKTEKITFASGIVHLALLKQENLLQK